MYIVLVAWDKKGRYLSMRIGKKSLKGFNCLSLELTINTALCF